MKKYTDLDALLADLRDMEARLSADDAMLEMGGVYLERDNAELLKHDPFSPEYHRAAKALYEQLSGVRDYRIEVNEQAPYIDAAQSASRPTPYCYTDSKTVGDFVSAWGWIFRVLDVRSGDRVLEYGPGEGQLAIMLARMGCSVSVIDINEKYLESIRLQSRSLGVEVRTRQGRFGEGFGDEKFDRILFFESFHHALEHQQLVKGFKTRLAEKGSVVFSGEPIVGATSGGALYVPFPWGPRLDGLSVRSTNRFGWCELGFQEEYFVELMMREGFLVSHFPCPTTGRGHCYRAVPCDGRVDAGAAFLLARSQGDAGWHQPEGSHRWTRHHACFTLPVEESNRERSATLVLTNFLPVDREGTVRAGGHARTFRVAPGARVPVTLAVPPAARYLEIITPPVVPSSIIPGSADRRELGVAVITIELQ